MAAIHNSLCAGLLALIAACASAGIVHAQDIDSAAPHALVVDVETGSVLFERAADAPIAPASIVKLMTAAIVFDEIAAGRLSLDDRFPVGPNAFRREGSSMFLNLGQEPTVAELLRGLIVQSGNDAAVVLAEGLAGSEAAFARRMTARGAEIGLVASRFENATGLPAEGQTMTARDMARLAQYILEAHPDHYPLYAETEFRWEGVLQRNRNPLLYMDVGGDGLKTGFTEASGYVLVGSAARDGRRVVVVVAGLPSAEARALEIRTLTDWALRSFETRRLGRAGDVVGDVRLWLGAEETVPVALVEDLAVAAPVGSGPGALSARIRYEGPLTAPVAAGDVVAEIVVSGPGVGEVRAPVAATRDAAAGGYGARFGAGLELLMRWAEDRFL